MNKLIFLPWDIIISVSYAFVQCSPGKPKAIVLQIIIYMIFFSFCGFYFYFFFNMNKKIDFSCSFAIKIKFKDGRKGR